MEGSLSKWTNVMKGWQYRWFVLDENSGLLSYYTSKEKMMRGVRRGCVRLKGAVVGIDDEDDSTFTVTVDHKTFHFQARDAQEREKWVRALEDTIFHHGNRTKWSSSQPSLAIIDLDNKVSEADAYLQLIIEQTKKLEERISTMSDCDDKVKCEIILEHANAMLDNIKHSIVLLQIAKNTAHPVNGIYQPLLDLHSDLVGSSVAPLSSLEVPTTSYSSSEGEEDFYDANDVIYSTHVSSTLRSPASDSQSMQTPCLETISYTNTSLKSDEIDYDALYEDEEEYNVQLEGSVITHLLSQVKIGMDLTKVVLPTFILERRSLLEMYADYFAHPDLFVEIANLKTPRERMVQLVKWYLSSYHAGRKSSVAKKPYNPILGEVFKCYWVVPNVESTTEDLVTDGPVPWCKKHHLSFIAEQVSHHPPISAFYAEHYDKRITFNAHVYTKSKFLGLSVCVNNIGKGVVTLLDHDEEYTVTFPNGYGRSILTVPWIELGGPVMIECPKTGYYCKIDFITKPFYGNRKHRVTAEIFGPNDKKSFMSISGEWNGVMDFKVSDTESELFVDVNAMTIVKKQVMPIKQQEENESRRLWKEVTAGLRFNDIEKATTAKQDLEQRQREEAKERKDTNIEWQTRMFAREGEDGWVYVNPLSCRVPPEDN